MHVACTDHVPDEKSAVVVHVACTCRVPHEKSAVVVDSIACSFLLGYHFRTAPCKETNQCSNLNACRYESGTMWHVPVMCPMNMGKLNL